MLLNFIFFASLFTRCETDKVDNGTKTVHFKGTDIVQQTIEYKNGKKNGFFTEYYRNGNIKAKQFFADDDLNDTSVFYNESGTLRSLHTYKNKLKHGCWKEYNKKGQLYSEIYLKNGSLDSTSTVYSYNSRKIITRVTYKDGLKNGSEERYYNNGKPKSIAYFDMGRACTGTEEWYENGKKVNNDFAITISEQNEVLIKGTLSYIIRLENQQSNDEVYQVMRKGQGRKVGAVFPLQKNNNSFVLSFNISKNSFVMEEVTLAAFRKTAMGNTYIKTKVFNVSSNNF
ncbi:MAG: hypothetical protein ABIP51_19685 [Bacteroidia bacterium]